MESITQRSTETATQFRSTLRDDTPVLPRELEIERITLGAPLLREDPAQIEHIRRELPSEAFTVQEHREIFEELCKMVDRGDPINIVILQTRLRAKGSSVGPAEIAALLDGVPRFSDLSSEIQTLKKIQIRREIMRCANAWQIEAQASDADIEALTIAIANRAADFKRSAMKQSAPIAISWGELCEMKFEPRETILHEVERGEVVMCPAITNRGKTTYWRNVALSLACGREFAPIVAAGEPRSILYLDFESRVHRARADITKMLGALTQKERAMISQNFHLIADCRIDDRPLTLSNPHHLEIVEAEARRVNADMLILDTLSAAFEIMDENSNAEASRVMKRLVGLAQRLNCVTVFLHHVGKAKQEEGQTVQSVHRARGASAYAGFSHAIFSLLPDPAIRERNIFECTKVKGERFDDVIINLDPQTRWFCTGEPAPKPLSTYDQIIGLFNGHALKRKAIQELLPKLPKSTLDRHLKNAVEKGDLVDLGHGSYEKKQSPQSHHPYRREDIEDFPESIETERDKPDFKDSDKNSSEDFFDPSDEEVF